MISQSGASLWRNLMLYVVCCVLDRMWSWCVVYRTECGLGVLCTGHNLVLVFCVLDRIWSCVVYRTECGLGVLCTGQNVVLVCCVPGRMWSWCVVYRAECGHTHKRIVVTWGSRSVQLDMAVVILIQELDTEQA